VLKFYRDFTQTAPDELVTYAGLLSAPDGTPVTALVVCYCGDLATGDRVLAPLRTFGTPILDTVQPMAFPVMQTLLDAAVPDGNQNYWKSAFIKGLSDETIETIVGYAKQVTSPLTVVILEQYGGAIGRIPSDATAFAPREAEYDLGILSQWSDPSESSRHVSWTREFSEAMSPFTTGAYLLNFLGDEGHDTVRAAFGANYPRLAQLKAKYDPTNFFRVNQNVVPADAAAV
jgi:berberine-like enzyme